MEGLLPPHISSYANQLQRTYASFLAKENPIEKNIYLASLHDRNETLFYRLILEHISEMVPIIYTPTVGEACQRYSHVFRRARGLYIPYPAQNRMDEILKNVPYDDISVIVVTDGERILGLGDLGVGGMGIPVGKLALYTLCAGIHPRKTLPIMLDVGTNNPDLLNDPIYLGWQHARIKGAEYDRFIESFVKSVKARWPKVLLQWEDFSKSNAWRLLTRYQDRICSFNDDIQGTAAVTLAGIMRAVTETGGHLFKEQFVIAGAGSAATGIGDLLTQAFKEQGISETEAKTSMWLVDSKGLVHQGRGDLTEEKKPFAHSLDLVRFKGMDPSLPIDLMKVVQNIKPGIMIGTSGQPGMFTEDIAKEMARWVKRPIIFPLSNPTSKSEATPEQLLRWTDGQALVSTGSPFDPVSWKGKKISIGQCNNAFIFPGVGLGIIVTKAKKVPEEVFLTAAKTLSRFDERLPGFEKSLAPNLEHTRKLSELIAVEVARRILQMGLADASIREEDIPDLVQKNMWEPVYPKLKRAGVPA